VPPFFVIKRACFFLRGHYYGEFNLAGVAQSVEQLICNQQVAGSSPIASSIGMYGEVPELAKGDRL
jgi:hypothetical protein